MTPGNGGVYTVKQFNLSRLRGISDRTMERHIALYQAQVDTTNQLTADLDTLSRGGREAGTDAVYRDLSQRLLFEYNGMVLHEFYFRNLTRTPADHISVKLTNALEANFGSVESFTADFKAIGNTPGVGWAILYQDPTTGRLLNHWITLNQDGHPAGYKPLLVMDAWEHAYLIDLKPAERDQYIDSFLANVDWDVVDKRLLPLPGAAGKPDTRPASS